MVWIVISPIVIWLIALLIFSYKRRLHLFNYLLYMLLDDSMRSDQRIKLEQFIKQSEAQDRTHLFNITRVSLENFIEGWAKATPSTVAAHELLWNSKKRMTGNMEQV